VYADRHQAGELAMHLRARNLKEVLCEVGDIRYTVVSCAAAGLRLASASRSCVGTPVSSRNLQKSGVQLYEGGDDLRPGALIPDRVRNLKIQRSAPVGVEDVCSLTPARPGSAVWQVTADSRTLLFQEDVVNTTRGW
jgi:hypothetical protein